MVGKINQATTRLEMPEAIIGNSRMLALLKRNGEIFKLFWPRIDYGQHLGRFWTGLRFGNSPTKWFHLGEWSSSQRYLADTNILETTLTGLSSQLSVTQWDFVLPQQDLLARHYKIENTGGNSESITFFLYCNFEIEESILYDGVYLDFASHALVFFRRDVYFAVAGCGYPLAGYQCGRRDTATDPYREATEGTLWGNRDSIRHGAGSLAWDLGEVRPGEAKTFTIYLAAGHGEEEVRALLAVAATRGGSEWLEDTRQYWLDWLQAGARTLEGVPAHPAYNRSLLAMKLMTCRETGASIAAPEFDPYYQACGGYGYCWPRDAVFVAAALDEAGYHQSAAQFYNFAAKIQNKEGDWRQRYFLDGMPAPFWGKQIDQTGAVLWGYWHHYSLTGDRDFLEQIWFSLAAAASYLTEHLEANGLPSPSFDPWEDEYLQGTYSAAAVCAGLKAASELAAVKGNKGDSDCWLSASKT
ncbi:MAG TPA: glycoside hydrolase family 15 protein, partial [Bacillota bacterium]|nr:glycoside hydrolase family 15 protein [Bacillota bacterium]